MSESEDALDPKIVLDRVISGLREGRNRAMQQRKAAIQKEFMIARRWIDDAYDSYDAEDLPVDVHRIARDLAVVRDQMVDSACWEIDREYRVAIGVLKIVAEQNPGYYCTAAKDGSTKNRSWKRPLPVVSAPRIASALPEPVLMGLSASRISDVVDLLIASEEGISLAEITRIMQLDAEEHLQARAAVKKFASFLRAGGYVETKGTGRGQRMFPAPTLSALRDQLVSQSEA